MLTLSTPIPTLARGQVRALVKAHPAWPAYLAGRGMLSASARNADLVEFALRHPELTTKIELVLGLGTAPAPVTATPALTRDYVSDALYLLARLAHSCKASREAGRHREVRVRVKAVSRAL